MNTKEEITGFVPANEFFIGIDSDGTAFDSMNIKHIKSMFPAALEIWDAGEYVEEFRKIWYRLNLYSKSRGINRFSGLLNALDELQEKTSYAAVADTAPLRDFVEKSEALSNAALHAWMKDHHNPLLEDVMRWSLLSDKLFEEYTRGLLPFANVKEALMIMAEKADIMVVSSASGKGLDKDWSFSGLTKYTSLLAGQELGSKKAQLRMGAAGKYPAQKILMLGDAPGDLEAARSINGLFFPIMPGKEEESWLRLCNESVSRFFAGTFQGEYEDALIREFMTLLE
ncbi:MAG: HAD family hydrolase [Spirochaetaceae bacterium]|jgi:phosphoglycolate phosphatase-like HAD superfamily hydrolase|nr:HAD family hydrolase [Spirochaetaceae bacterium]